MARDSKIEVAAVNLRIPNLKKRDYLALMKLLYEQRLPVNFYGESHVVITHFDEETRRGTFSKYTEIELDGQWFDIEKQDAASPEDVGKIEIPAKLKPNLAQFYFLLDEGLHTVAFESYVDSKSLSLKGVAKYFNSALATKAVTDQFGRVESDIVSSYQAAQALLKLPDLKEVRITIRLPNSDDIGDDLAHEIEARLRQQNGEEYEETIRAKGKDALRPDERTQTLATVAAENGEVEVQSVVNGVKKRQKSSDTPLTEAEKFQPDEESSLLRFYAVSKRLFDKVTRARREARG
jgi:hypothetical protein